SSTPPDSRTATTRSTRSLHHGKTGGTPASWSGRGRSGVPSQSSEGWLPTEQLPKVELGRLPTRFTDPHRVRRTVPPAQPLADGRAGCGYGPGSDTTADGSVQVSSVGSHPSGVPSRRGATVQGRGWTRLIMQRA